MQEICRRKNIQSGRDYARSQSRRQLPYSLVIPMTGFQSGMVKRTGGGRERICGPVLIWRRDFSALEPAVSTRSRVRSRPVVPAYPRPQARSRSGFFESGSSPVRPFSSTFLHILSHSSTCPYALLVDGSIPPKAGHSQRTPCRRPARFLAAHGLSCRYRETGPRQGYGQTPGKAALSGRLQGIFGYFSGISGDLFGIFRNLPEIFQIFSRESSWRLSR